MSNDLYYARRAAGQCPDCGEPVTSGVYCELDRLRRNIKVAIDRALDRRGYNQYMRIYKSSVAMSPSGSDGNG